MPGGSKEGGGLETKKSTFYLKSGNSPLFKKMGSSPAKQGMPKSFNMRGGPSNTPGFSETKIGKATRTFGKIGKIVRGSTLVGAAHELFKGWGKMNPKFSKPPTAGKI